MNARPVGLDGYDSIKGALKANVGNDWKLRLHHMNGGISSWTSLTKPLSSAKPEWQDAIRASLHRDASVNLTSSVQASDPYGWGKEMARLARLLLIAEEMQEDEIATRLRSQLQTAFLPWLHCTNSDSLQYDSVWGGLVPKDGVQDKNADYGAGWYNDHHFHWGYHIYAAAAVAKGDRAWAEKWKAHIFALVRDIANPSLLVQAQEQENLPLDAALEGTGESTPFTGASDTHFPTLRHMDVFESHSWANALFASPIGRNQESSTEAVNAYYAIALLGKAMEDPSLTYLGEVLTSLELTGTHRYWHLTSEKSVYPQPFARENRCVGMVWSSKVVVQTWFAVGCQYTRTSRVRRIVTLRCERLAHAFFVVILCSHQWPTSTASTSFPSPRSASWSSLPPGSSSNTRSGWPPSLLRHLRSTMSGSASSTRTKRSSTRRRPGAR
jgi:endo-1,3(4)-beta-glucanase